MDIDLLQRLHQTRKGDLVATFHREEIVRLEHALEITLTKEGLLLLHTPEDTRQPLLHLFRTSLD